MSGADADVEVVGELMKREMEAFVEGNEKLREIAKDLAKRQMSRSVLFYHNEANKLNKIICLRVEAFSEALKNIPDCKDVIATSNAIMNAHAKAYLAAEPHLESMSVCSSYQPILDVLTERIGLMPVHRQGGDKIPLTWFGMKNSDFTAQAKKADPMKARLDEARRLEAQLLNGRNYSPPSSVYSGCLCGERESPYSTK